MRESYPDMDLTTAEARLFEENCLQLRLRRWTEGGREKLVQKLDKFWRAFLHAAKSAETNPRSFLLKSKLNPRWKDP